MEWIPRVRASEKVQFIQSVHEEGFEEFDIRPDSQSKDYFPITYLAPFTDNAAALGFDLASEEVRGAALLTAWESGEISLTEPITLVQESGKQLAFLIYAPIYSSANVPTTLQARRELLEGFALGVFRFGDFINNSIPDSFDSSIKITVIDSDDDDDDEVILFTSEDSSQPASSGEGLVTNRDVKIADEEWQFRFAAPAGYGLGALERIAWVLVLSLGILFSVIVLGVALLLYKGRQAALLLSVERLSSE